VNWTGLESRMAQNNDQIIGLVAAYLVVEVVKFLVPFIKRRKSCLSSEETYFLKTLFEMHNAKDDEGRFLWYVPKNVSIQLIDIVKTMNAMSHHQEKIADVLDRVMTRLEKS